MKSADTNSRKQIFESFSRFSGLLFFILLMFVFFQAKNNVFLSWANIITILRQVSIYGIVGIGMGFLLLNGYLDLSVGANMGLCAMVVGLLITSAGLPIWLAILLTILCGSAIGAINGTLITLTGVPPFIFTLAMTQVLRGVVYIITGGKTIGNFDEAFLKLGSGTVSSIPIPVIIFFVLLVLAWFILNCTVFGRSVYISGGNPVSAKYSGLNNKRIAVICYAICGATAAIAGIILTSKLRSTQPTLGQNYEMEAIMVAVIGGMSLSGGVGSIVGIFLGALVTGVIDNGMIMAGITSYWQMVVKGLVIIIAVVFDILRKKGVRDNHIKRILKGGRK